MSKDKMSEIDEHIAKRFEIHKRLGKGAYGIVWKAVDKKSKEIVAVKKIFDAFRNQTDAQRTFREIMFLQSFKSHPNIIKLHSVHRALNNRDIYLGFEYMETDLHNVIKRGNVLKDVHKRYIMYQLLKATKYMHSGNVIHRDQKPSNILLDTLCRCKIADFGLARSLTQLGDGSPNSETDPTLTDYVATRWYRAPEILIANRHYTKGIDMWSLGCILGEMIAGKPIFPGSSTVNQIERIMATIPTPSNEDIHAICVTGVGASMIKNASAAPRVAFRALLGSDVPTDAVDLINKLLILNPNKRFTAEQAIKHQYVARFRDPRQELEMESDVLIPFNDDVRLSIDDYRNKLYEYMTTSGSGGGPAKAGCTNSGGQTKLKPVKPRTKTIIKVEPEFKPKSRPGIYQPEKSTSTLRSTNMTQSEIKLHTLYRPRNTNMMIRSESKLPQQRQPHHEHKNGGWKPDVAKKSNKVGNAVKEEKPRRLSSNSNVYMSYNSYNPSHGIITQSALMELRAAGLR